MWRYIISCIDVKFAVGVFDIIFCSEWFCTFSQQKFVDVLTLDFNTTTSNNNVSHRQLYSVEIMCYAFVGEEQDARTCSNHRRAASSRGKRKRVGACPAGKLILSFLQNAKIFQTFSSLATLYLAADSKNIRPGRAAGVSTAQEKSEWLMEQIHATTFLLL